LEGSIAIRTGGELLTVVLKDVLRHVGEPLEDEGLKSLGVSVQVVEYNKELGPEGQGNLELLQIEIAFNRDVPLSDFALTDSQGKPIDKAKVFAFDVNNSVTLNCFCEKRLKPDTQLRLVVHQDSRKVRVPFAFKDIAVPPIPKEGDGGTVNSLPDPMEEKK
jgi:hypothetical protein